MKPLSERIPTAVRSPPDSQDLPMVAPSPYYAGSPVRRSAPGLPFGWGAVTVLLVGAALLILGILLILYGFLNFLTGTIGQATSSSFSVTEFFQSFFGAAMLFVIGGVLAGIGGSAAACSRRGLALPSA